MKDFKLPALKVRKIQNYKLRYVLYLFLKLKFLYFQTISDLVFKS